jgi:hypothetical protein
MAKCPSCGIERMDTKMPCAICGTSAQSSVSGGGNPGSTKPCPYCGEPILLVAIKCKHCGEMLESSPVRSKPAAQAGRSFSASRAPAAEDADDEQTIFTLKPATRAYLGVMIAAGFGSLVGIIVLLMIDLNAFASIVIPPLLIGGITALVIWTETHSTEYKLTTQRFFLKKGIIAKKLDELELFRVKDVSVTQGILQRMLGFGSISILSTDDSTPVIFMRNIANPSDIKEIFRKAYRSARKREGIRATEFIPS